jgi:hypothetical protein
MKRIALLLALVLLSSVQAEAEEATAYGWGATSCGEWTAHEANRSKQPIESIKDPTIVGQDQWVLGFLSGYNFSSGARLDVAKGLSPLGLFGWLDNYCAAHPLDAIGTATIALIGELSKRQNDLQRTKKSPKS